MMRLTTLRRALGGVVLAMAWACAFTLASCGGAGTDGTGPAENSVNVGVLKGLAETSVTVNGVTYDSAAATVLDGFGQAAGADALRLGMWLEVTGHVDETSGAAVALTIRVRPASRGVVTAVDAGALTLTVLQSAARYADGVTVVDGTDGAAAIAPGDVVEVHGPLGAGAGAVEASRIERLAGGTDARKPVELRGRVSALDTVARTLTVGRQPVHYDGAALTLRQALANGQVLRVSALAAPVGTRPWRVERMTSDQPLPEDLSFVYAEGVTTDWATGPLFQIEGVKVDASAANNRGVITADGQRVALIGALVKGTLVAKSVTRSVPGQPVVFVLSGGVSSFHSLTDFRMRGVAIDAGAATLVGGLAAEVIDGRRVKVTGSVSGRRLIASRLELL